MHGISRATFFTWKSKYGGATVGELERMYAQLALENAAIKDVLIRKLSRRPRSDR